MSFSPTGQHRATPIRAWMRTTRRSGSYVVWFPLCMFALAVMLGLAWDGGTNIAARQRANLVAEEAARAAGQQVVRPLGMRGIAAVPDPITGQAAAQAYLALNPDVHGVASIAGPTTVVVVTEITWKPDILGFVGVGPKVVTGRAIINLNRTNNGAPGLP